MKYFSLNEFDSPDKKGSGEEMKSSTLQMLERAREIAGVPFVINSGYRTPSHNRKVGGVSSSSHTKGYAVDISARSSSEKYVILDALLNAGFNRIGVGNSFIHADNDPAKPKNVIWTY